MCNCVEDLLKPNNFTNKKGEVPERLEMNRALVLINNRWEYTTKTDVKAIFPNRKKPIVVQVFHNFCPWCGEKIERDE